MKNLLCCVVILITGSRSFAQNDPALFLNYALSYPLPVYQTMIEDGAGYEAMASGSAGLRYYMKSSKIVTLETGVDYSGFHFETYGIGLSGPNKRSRETAKLLSIPVYAHLTFLKYLFVNGGIILDADLHSKQNILSKQTGLGFGFGIGLKLNVQKIQIFVNPFYERHAYITLENRKGTIRQSIKNPGGRIGIGYSF
jgi:hypothetical protein